MELGVPEILIILVLALLLFGPSKLPQLGDALGKSIRNFKRASGGADEEPPREPAALPPASAPAEPPARERAPAARSDRS